MPPGGPCASAPKLCIRGFFVADETDIRYMQRALELVARGRFRTAPNPMVGAVIVRQGRIIGEGYHRKAGSDHADIAAIRNAVEPVAGSTVYVTLEPCCHTGRTGPCTAALIEHGVARVVFAATDPDPRVRGKGARRLRQAGIRVEAGILREQAVRLNEVFFAFHRTGRPFIILKTAQTLDGRIGAGNGDSKWISSPASRRMAHELRAEADAIVVGGGTVRRDNPALTVRHVTGPDPYRVILSASLRFPKSCRLLDDNADARTIIATMAENVERFARTRRGRSLTFWSIRRRRDGQLDVADLVRKAGQFGLRSLLVEGGSRVATSFLKAGLVDKYVAFVAPKLLGTGIDAVGDLGIASIDRALTFARTEILTCGPDIVVIGYPKRRK